MDRSVVPYNGDDILIIESSEKRVWSVNCPVGGGVAIVHINESHGALTCSVCKSSTKWCAHKQTLNQYIFDNSGGKLDVKKIFAKNKVGDCVVNVDTGEISEAIKEAFMPKDLSSVSQMTIPPPKCFSIESDFKNENIVDIDIYYNTKPLVLRQFPSELKYVLASNNFEFCLWDDTLLF